MTEPARSARDAPPFRSAMGLVTRTAPFLLLNLAIYGGSFLVLVLWLGTFGGLAVLFGERVEILAFIFMMMAILGPIVLLSLGKRYFLYLVKGAHIATMTKLITHGELPGGQGQVEYGRGVVRRYFKEVSVLFALERMVDRTARGFTRRFVRIVDWLPLGGGASKAARWAQTVVNRSLQYVDQAVISHVIAKEDENIWSSARDGLVLYAQAYPPILATSVKVWLMGKAFYLLALVLLAVPGIALLVAFSAGWFQVAVVVGVLVGAQLLVLCVFEPFATAWTLATYHHATDGLQMNEEWRGRLEQASDHFGKLGNRARDFTRDVGGMGGDVRDATSGGAGAGAG
ncbi:MAG: hypothetical protein EA352_00570 [Gemmatimonadales bacterium]|nr:MAG: hypothetical protein EA352_00570 [Gemmatimonadales bacterium]